MQIFPKLTVLVVSLSLFLGCKKDSDTPVNKSPIADAGAYTIINAPINSVTLNGSGTDADGNVVAYLWSEVSGPNTPIINTPGSLSTVVNGLVEGTYLFQLMVTDDVGATGVDTVSVEVNPSLTDTLTLIPNNNPEEYWVAIDNGQDIVSPNAEISLAAWTKNGQPITIREIIKFDLNPIPANATITSAKLSLYSNPNPFTGNFQNANYGTDNSILLQQIVSPWSSSTINWNSQPAVSSANQIIIPSTTSSFLDLDINVTDMVSSMINNSANFGFSLRLQNEVTYTSRIFCSSYHPDVTKHPKLVIVYRRN